MRQAQHGGPRLKSPRDMKWHPTDVDSDSVTHVLIVTQVTLCVKYIYTYHNNSYLTNQLLCTA